MYSLSILQAQKSIDISFQKLRLLKISLENRLEEFPRFIKVDEQNGETTPTILPRPAQLTGTLYLKLLGVEGLLDLSMLRAAVFDTDLPAHSPSRTYSASHIVKNTARNFMTLPTPSHRDREREREKERDKSDEEISSGSSAAKRRGSKHIRNKQSASSLQKQNSLDNIDISTSEYF